MKTTLIIIAALICVTVVLVVFYQPANQIVRRAFQQLTGTVVVSQVAYDEMKAKNKALEYRAEALQEEIEDYQKEQKVLQQQIISGQQEVDAAKSKADAKEKELAEYHKLFEQMSDDDAIVLFDQMTEGDVYSVKHDDNRVLTSGNRIRDATLKLHERVHYKELTEEMQIVIDAQDRQITRMRTLTATLNIQLALTIEKKDIYGQQYQNCLDAQDDLKREANRKAIVGYVVGVAGILFALLI